MTAEDAIKSAIDEVKKLFAGTDHRLEEIEYKGNGDFEVTISFLSRDAPRPFNLGTGSFYEGLSGRKAAIGVDASRTYKDVLVSNGVVKAIRMRQIVLG